MVEEHCHTDPTTQRSTEFFAWIRFRMYMWQSVKNHKAILLYPKHN